MLSQGVIEILRIIVLILLGLFLLADILFGLYPSIAAGTSSGLSNKRSGNKWSSRQKRIDGSDPQYMSRAYFQPGPVFSNANFSPYISPADALAQLNSVAKARNLTSEQKLELAELISNTTEMPLMTFFGSPSVNLLKLNPAIDTMFGMPDV
jgi:potassium-transporting ATPase KdpC subunit